MSAEPPTPSSRIEIRERLKLYLILESTTIRLPLGDFIMQAIEGGVTAVQLRDKTSPIGDRFETAKQIKSLLEGSDTLFIINNDADIALTVGADGVHLGVDDLPPSVVKSNFSNLIVGYSCNNIYDCSVAMDSGVDYVGIGPTFYTATKKNLRPVLGVDGVNTIAKNMPLPSVAIGGIDLSNISELTSLSVDGVAISAALCQSETPYDTAMQFRAIIDQMRKRQ